MHRLKPIYLSLISGIILVLAWPPLPTAFLLFISFVPIFMIHEYYEVHKDKRSWFWAYAYLALLIFNSGTTWWVWNASPSGCIMMLVLNSLLMSLPFLGYAITKKLLPKMAYAAFVCLYLGFEYFHFNWSASWPWMTLGKGFATIPSFIQWYEFTGEMGGSGLILIMNVIIAGIVSKRQYAKLWRPAAGIAAIWILSLAVQSRYSGKPEGKPVECVISQPNIDPYTEKFGQDGDSYLYPEIQLEYAMDVAAPFITSKTNLVLMPETAIVGFNDENDFGRSNLISPLRDFTDSTGIYVLAGAETYSNFEGKERPTLTARFDSLASAWYDNYNSAILVEHGKVSNVYHKSRLVPGVEKMPFEFLEKLSISLGGTSGSLGTSKKPVNFTINDGIKIAPLVCYESVFGDYTNEFVKDGANILAVVTNDGWWGETPGYAQHLLFGAIRCIETRREMVRSANTGVSAKIDRLGYIHERAEYKRRVGFACQAYPFSNLTSYVQFGNIVGKAGAFFSVLIILILIIKAIGRLVAGKSRQKENI